MKQINEITGQIIDAAIEVHRHLGPVLLESAYEVCLVHELLQRSLKVEQQVPLPVTYKQVYLDCVYRLDVVVEDAVIVELKSVAQIEPIHEAQLLSYLKLADKRVALLINFNVRRLIDGVRRLANNL